MPLKLLERFLRYVQIDTTSDPDSTTYPSTAKQWDLLRLLADELREIGAEVTLTSHGYVIAEVAATAGCESVPVVALLAHADTAPDFSGTNVKPIVHHNYQGGVLRFPDDADQVIDPSDTRYADLLTAVGKDVVTASGTTLLGADDKAGVAILVTLAAQRLHFAPYSVDNRFFSRQAELLQGQRLQLRRRFGIIGEGPCILFAGKLIAKKQPQALLQAFQAVRAKYACTLLFAGEGELRPVLEAQVRDGKIPDVHFAGFLNQTEIGAAYACADIFVLPSLYAETWGLVVNEAMNFALPVVVSDAVGCADDLVRQRENGFVVSASRFVTEGADAIAALVADAELRRAYGARSREMIAEWDVTRTADGIVAAALAVNGDASVR